MSLFRRTKSVVPAATPPAAPPQAAPTPGLTIDPTFGDQDAVALRAAMARGDWPAARTLLSAGHDDDDFAFLVDQASNVTGSEQWLPEAVRADLDDPLPLLVYGTRAIRWGWEARTRAQAKNVSRDQFNVFFERLRLAEDCLQDVVARDPKNTAAWTGLVTIARGLQLGMDETRRRFDRVLEQCPTHFTAHHQMLQRTCSKWSGSHEQMHAFAAQAVAAAPPGNRLGSLVAAAHIEQRLEMASSGGQYFKAPEVLTQLRAAAERSIWHTDYRPGKGWPQVHNPFAMAFSFAGDQAAAADQFRIIGDLITELPWAHFRAEPVEGFIARRAIAYVATDSPGL